MSTAVWDAWSCRVRVTVDGGDADLRAAVGVVRGVMDDVDVAVSRFRGDSDLARVNAAAGRWVPVRPLTLELTRVALKAARRTDGAVDPTVGGHVLDAGYVGDIEQVRGRTLAAHTVPRAPRARWQSVRLDPALGRLGVPAGLLLDLGATAKAWTADEAARRAASRTGRAVLVEIGGDLAVAGAGPRPWRVDVAEVTGGPAHRVDLTHGGLATSSVLARRWSSASGPQHHLIDPRTSRPATGVVRTATVWAASAVVANTWSTAAVVWGRDAAARLAAASVDARLVGRDGTVTAVGAWPRDEGVAA